MQSAALDISRQGIQVGLMVSAPVLAVALFAGLLVSVFQAVTQVQEVTLSYVPKLIGAAVVVALMGNWMVTTVVAFTRLCLEQAGQLAR